MIAEQTRTAPPPTLRLYQFGGEFEALEELLIESFGELTPEIEALMGDLNSDLDRKIDGYCGLIQNFSRTADAAKAEVKRLTELAKAREAAATRLKERLKFGLDALEIAKRETGTFSVRIQANPPSVSVAPDVDLAALPPSFVRTKLELDSAAVKEAAKRGDTLPTGLSITVGSHIRIR